MSLIDEIHMAKAVDPTEDVVGQGQLQRSFNQEAQFNTRSLLAEHMTCYEHSILGRTRSDSLP